VSGHPLDRPIWAALHSRQSHLRSGGGLAVRFPVDISPFVAARENTAEAVAAIAALMPEGDDISLMEVAPPEAPPGIEATSGDVFQMEARGISGGGAKPEFLALDDVDAPDMLELALQTRPGPFRAKTHTLGRFVGIRDRGRLVAMAGERMQTDGFIEISAVCTHPDHRGRGYGAALMRVVGQRILDDGATPILHTYSANAGAVALYRKLGFEVRRDLVHALWKRA
jgi:ribosomal protein S18 acetylase RimI-like enzyme